MARLRKLLRRRDIRDVEGVFVAEGIKLLGEAMYANADIESVFVAGSYNSPDISRLTQQGVRVYRVEEHAFARIATTTTPQPVLTVIRRPAGRLPANDLGVFANADAVVMLVDIQDPGNAGTIMRASEAAGFAKMIFAGTSVDPYHPKLVRSSAGAIFHVSVIVEGDATAALHQLTEAGLTTIATAKDAPAYDAAPLTERVALVFGNEANGLDATTRAACARAVSIPHIGRAESLNVAMAASVLCFEYARQKRASHGLN